LDFVGNFRSEDRGSSWDISAIYNAFQMSVNVRCSGLAAVPSRGSFSETESSGSATPSSFSETPSSTYWTATASSTSQSETSSSESETSSSFSQTPSSTSWTYTSSSLTTESKTFTSSTLTTKTRTVGILGTCSSADFSNRCRSPIFGAGYHDGLSNRLLDVCDSYDLGHHVTVTEFQLNVSNDRIPNAQLQHSDPNAQLQHSDPIAQLQHSDHGDKDGLYFATAFPIVVE